MDMDMHMLLILILPVTMFMAIAVAAAANDTATSLASAPHDILVGLSEPPPLVSVVLLVCGEGFLRQSLASLAEQSYPSLEVMVVNDGAALPRRFFAPYSALDVRVINLPRATISNIDLGGETLLSPYLQPYTLIDLAGGRKMAVLSIARLELHLSQGHGSRPQLVR